MTVILVGSGTRASRLFVIYVISKATNLQCAQTKISVAGVVSRATLPVTVLKICHLLVRIQLLLLRLQTVLVLSPVLCEVMIKIL